MGGEVISHQTVLLLHEQSLTPENHSFGIVDFHSDFRFKI
jgi:hypothetical protein